MIALNDGIADGRDISWIWDADFENLAPNIRRVACSGTRAQELALRLKYAGLRRDRGDRDARAGSRSLAGSWRWPAALRASHLHGFAGAAPPARCTWPTSAVLGSAVSGAGAHLSPASAPPRADLARPRMRRIHGGHAALAEAAAAARRPRRSSSSDRQRDRPRDARPGAQGPCDRAGHGPRAGRRASPERGTRAASGPDGDGRRAWFELGSQFALAIAPMQVAQLLGGDGGTGCSARSSVTCAPAVAPPLRSPTRSRGMPSRRCRRHPRRPRDRRLGLLQPSGGGPRAGGTIVIENSAREAVSTRAAVAVSRPRRPGGPRRSRASRGARSEAQLEADRRSAGRPPSHATEGNG